MARVTYSPIVTRLSGSVADATFAHWKGRSYLRARVTPTNPNTADQQKQRNKLKYSVLQWQGLDTDVKANWNEYASPYAKSGFNYWCDFNIPQQFVADALNQTLAPPNSDLAGPTDFAAATGSGAGEIDCTWSAGATGAGIYIEIWAFKAGAAYFDTAPVQCSTETVLASAGSVTLTGLDAGEDYNVVAAIKDTNLSERLFSQSYADNQVTAHA